MRVDGLRGVGASEERDDEERLRFPLAGAVVARSILLTDAMRGSVASIVSSPPSTMLNLGFSGAGRPPPSSSSVPTLGRWADPGRDRAAELGRSASDSDSDSESENGTGLLAGSRVAQFIAGRSGRAVKCPLDTGVLQ